MHLPITIVRDGLKVGRHTIVSFNRTLRIPEDGKRYKLPGGLGRLPILRVEDVSKRVPEKWRREGGLIIPLYQSEALYLEFMGARWRPVIAKAAVGNVNAITGKPHDLSLKAGRQDYVVVPVQRWLDGIYCGDNTVKQFVAMPLGQGYTIEAQVTDEEVNGGFQLAVFEPKEGKFIEPPQQVWSKNRGSSRFLFSQPSTDSKDQPLYSQGRCDDTIRSQAAAEPAYSHTEILEMGIAAGGSIEQQIFEDDYGINTWNERAYIALNIHIVNSAVYKEITGKRAPTRPITAAEYTKYGIPWFSHYDETRRSAHGGGLLKRIRSIQQIGHARGIKPVQESFSKELGTNAIKVSTLKLPDRVNELLFNVKTSYQARKFSECLTYSHLCGELIEMHVEELAFKKAIKSAKSIAGECYCIASDSCIALDNASGAEDFANRALILEFSEKALECRMYARLKSGNIEGAREDCDELLCQNDTNKLAIEFRFRLGASKDSASPGEHHPIVDSVYNVRTRKHSFCENATIFADNADNNTKNITLEFYFRALCMLIAVASLAAAGILGLNWYQNHEMRLEAPLIDKAWQVNIKEPEEQIKHLNESILLPKPIRPTPIVTAPAPANIPQQTLTTAQSHVLSQPKTYKVVGVSRGDALNVRTGPGIRHSRVTQWKNGTSGINIVGGPVYADKAKWYNVERDNLSGWVNSKYLAATSDKDHGETYPSQQKSIQQNTSEVYWNGKTYIVRNNVVERLRGKIRLVDQYVSQYVSLKLEYNTLLKNKKQSGLFGQKRENKRIEKVLHEMNKAEKEGNLIINQINAILRTAEVK
jgi:hypothetical protein